MMHKTMENSTSENGKGKLLVFSAPSGSGKTTLVHYLLESIDSLAFSVSATSREKRAGEIDGKDYYFMSPDRFRELINQNAFLEWEEVYDGIYYGTLFTEVERLMKMGKYVVFDVDVVGGLNIKKHYGSQALAVFIQAPSTKILAQRLRNRSTDSEESIGRRIEKAGWEMTFAEKFDVVIVNDELEQAKKQVFKLVNEFIKK